MAYLLGLLCQTTVAASTIHAPSPDETRAALYKSLDPQSLKELLAFYNLYPQTAEGALALAAAQKMVGYDDEKEGALEKGNAHPCPWIGLLEFMDKEYGLLVPPFTPEQHALITCLGKKLYNRKLQGYSVWDESQMLALPSEEIDLARAALIAQLDSNPEKKADILQYEAELDLMALQILAQLPPEPSDEEKIRAINTLLFQKMRFRFPPHSLSTPHIDRYSFLSSVLDNHLGVCLGVSVLYLCLAQRINLPTQVITPPGHIYVTVCIDGHDRNIETTARGIHIDTQDYYGIETLQLHKRTLKEVVGLLFYNQASTFLSKQEFKKANQCYQKAQRYLPEDDPEFLFTRAVIYVLLDKAKEARTLFQKIAQLDNPYRISENTIVADWLRQRVDKQGILAVHLHVDDDEASIRAKQKTLQKTLKRFSRFRAGYLALAITHLQLHENDDAERVLLAAHALDPNNILVEHFLSSMAIRRINYPMAWRHFHNVERLWAEKNNDDYPALLVSMRRTLKTIAPYEPL